MLDKKKIIVASFLVFLMVLVAGIYFFVDLKNPDTNKEEEEQSRLVSTVRSEERRVGKEC